MLHLLLWIGALQAANNQPYELRRDLLRFLGLAYVLTQVATASLGLGWSLLPGLLIVPAAARTYLE